MNKIAVYICLIVFFSSCSAVFEKSIKDQSIEIYIPADSSKTKVYSQQFYWEKVSGATSYRLQIASPGFGSIQRMIIDTIMTANSITLLLSPGEYEWRLRGQNAGSETAYFTRKLFIDETVFNQRPMIIKTPASTSIFSYKSSISFEWYAVTGAQNYTIEIDTLNGNFSHPMLTVVDYTQLVAIPALSHRGNYKWRMFADSAGVKSLYSSIGYIDFRLDTAALSSPGNNAVNVSQNPDLTWNEPLNKISGEQYTYELYLYNSTNSSDVVTTYSQSMPITVLNAKTKQLVGLEKGKTYYWAIIAIDQYGVTSQLTSKRKFTVSN